MARSNKNAEELAAKIVVDLIALKYLNNILSSEIFTYRNFEIQHLAKSYQNDANCTTAHKKGGWTIALC